MNAAPRPSLAQVQAWMKWIITEPDGTEVALGQPEERFEPEPKPSCLLAIEETPSFSRRERLDVYAEGYYVRIHASLAEDFQAVERWMGDGEFRSLISDYLLEHPSRGPDLLEVGRHLPEYLESWLEPGESPFLPALARLEWVRAIAYFAENPKPWNREALSRKSADELASLRLEPAPATALVEADWALDDLRQQLRAETWREDAPRQAPAQEKRFLVVYRDALWPKTDPVNEAEFRLLDCAKQGLTLGEACGRMAEFPDVTPELLFQWLAKWTSCNAICCGSLA